MSSSVVEAEVLTADISHDQEETSPLPESTREQDTESPPKQEPDQESEHKPKDEPEATPSEEEPKPAETVEDATNIELAPLADAPDYEMIITELRVSLAHFQEQVSEQATRIAALSAVGIELDRLKDEFTFVSASKEAMTVQLREEITRREAAEESVTLLRGQVDSARRGVMQLQRQEQDRRRVSGLEDGADEERLAPVQPTAGVTSRAAKRQSYLGRPSHRRVSSQSEPDSSLLTASPPAPSPPVRTTGGLRELRLGQNSPITSQTPLHATSPGKASPGKAGSSVGGAQGGFFDDASSNGRTSPNPSRDSAVLDATLQASRDETAHVRAELVALHAKLAESEEARTASENCLRALREFMASSGNSVDIGDDASLSSFTPSNAEAFRGLRLPPLPTDRDVDDQGENAVPLPKVEQRKDKGWGSFRLWKAPVATPGSQVSNVVEPPSTPQIDPSSTPTSALSPTSSRGISPLPTPDENAVSTPAPISAFVSSWTKSVVPPETAPLASRKISSFFSRSRAATTTEKDLPAPPIENATSEATAEDDELAHLVLPPKPSEDIPSPVDTIHNEPLLEGEHGVDTADERRTSTASGSTAEEVVGTPAQSPRRTLESEQGKGDSDDVDEEASPAVPA